MRKLLARKRVPRTNGRRIRYIRSICRDNKSTSARKRSSFLRTVTEKSRKERDTCVLYFLDQNVVFLQFITRKKRETIVIFMQSTRTHAHTFHAYTRRENVLYCWKRLSRASFVFFSPPMLLSSRFKVVFIKVIFKGNVKRHHLRRRRAKLTRAEYNALPSSPSSSRTKTDDRGRSSSFTSTSSRNSPEEVLRRAEELSALVRDIAQVASSTGPAWGVEDGTSRAGNI